MKKLPNSEGTRTPAAKPRSRGPALAWILEAFVAVALLSGPAGKTGAADPGAENQSPCDPDQVYTGQQVEFASRVSYTVPLGTDAGLVINTFAGTFAILHFDGRSAGGGFVYTVVGKLGDLCGS